MDSRSFGADVHASAGCCADVCVHSSARNPGTRVCFCHPLWSHVPRKKVRVSLRQGGKK